MKLHGAAVASLFGLALAACGGRLLDDEDATAPDGSVLDASDAGDGAYTGEWCDPETGPTDGPGGGAIFCLQNAYTDAPDPEHCHKVWSATVQWNCCTADNFDCCPLAAHAEDYGEILSCCASKTDCTACCDGIDPKP